MKADTTAYLPPKFCSLTALQKEMSGYLIGGYITLIEALAKQIEAKSGTIHLETPVQRVLAQVHVAGQPMVQCDLKTKSPGGLDAPGDFLIEDSILPEGSACGRFRWLWHACQSEIIGIDRRVETGHLHLHVD